jgi:hypothetical protein
VLDPARVEVKLADSAAVSALLSDIFVDEEEPAAPPAAPDPPPAGDGERLAGLDTPHSSLLRALAAREAWTRAEVEVIASERGLLPDGALDTINEAALEACGEPVCEGDDPIELNTEALKELLA